MLQTQSEKRLVFYLLSTHIMAVMTASHAHKKIPLPSPDENEGRDRINITLPKWLREKATRYGAKKGYSMSELISRLLERWCENEDERIDQVKKLSDLVKKV